MKCDKIDCFVASVSEVVNTLENLNFSVGKPSVKASPFCISDISVMMGMTGDVCGHILIHMDDETSKDVASAIMMGMKVELVDEMSKAALSEFGNMIMSRVISAFKDKNMSVNTMPPIVVTGNRIFVSSGSMRTVGIPIASGSGDMVVDVSIFRQVKE